ncbi:isochorismatase family cysteine hydrolase [Cryptosporangium aurantiacum]|nr:isochorismatase family cysteine hydrolase [Cryptosporangium aurantiacum]
MSVRGLDNGEHAALIINECQNSMVNPEIGGRDGLAGEAARRHLVPRLAELAQACREAGVLVVHTTIVPRRDYAGTMRNCLLLASLVKKGTVVAGSPAAQIHPDLAPQDGDVVSERVHGLSPFHSTELEPILRSRGVQTVMIAGVSTNIGVPGACLEAVNRGFNVVVPEDCTAGAWPEAHEFQVTHTLPLLATVTTSDAIRTVLAGRTVRA